VMVFMLVFAPVHWINSNFNNAILDGTYRINAAVTFPHSNEVLYLPADIHISSDVEYRDSYYYYYLGAVEMESSNADEIAEHPDTEAGISTGMAG